MPTLLTTRQLKEDLAYVSDQLRQHADPFDTLHLMWQQRFEELSRELERLQGEQISHAEVALLFEGEPVIGSEEIRLQFATRVLEHYQNFVAVIAAEKSGAELKSKGQIPKAFATRLFIKDMLRGSVGFLLEESAPTQGSIVPTVLKEAIEEATQALDDLSSDNAERFQTRVESLSPRALNAVKKITKTLSEAGAETRIVDANEELSLGHKEIATLNTRLNEVDVLERTEELSGVVLGIFPDRQQFEFQSDTGIVLHGSISEELDRRYLADPNSIVLKPTRARFTILTEVRGDSVFAEDRILESLVPIER